MTPKNQYVLSPFFLDEPLFELEALAKPDWIINKPWLPKGDKPARISIINKGIARLVAGIVSSGNRPVSISGDCLSAIGVLAGLQRAGIDPFLLWFDAHGDFNTWETTPSGFLGGMPLAMIAGRGDQSITRSVGLKPLPETRIILSDGRDLDPGERLSLSESAIMHLRDPNRMAADSLPDLPLVVHVDTDIIAPEEAPAMNYPAPGGLSVADLKGIFSRLADRKRIAAVSLSSWNPRLDKDKISEKASMELLASLVGRD
jgi:arginase